MMLTHCGNNVRNRYSGCVFSVKDIVPVPLKTSRNPDFLLMGWYYSDVNITIEQSDLPGTQPMGPLHWPLIIVGGVRLWEECS